ncbi:hypothetical protein HMPREF0970_01752 [Schaalia odontolytica F0309]|uniref:Uncharacterized protein n=1 Tax=Schaalia odontolytica F0309 TaxID=649742 RepID=D4U0K9_9ACTO|nr:hypothetical protein HMPREF0970_01752 [Schaalia odontolytica F0309]
MSIDGRTCVPFKLVGDDAPTRVIHRCDARGTQMTMAGRILVMSPRRGVAFQARTPAGRRGRRRKEHHGSP